MEGIVEPDDSRMKSYFISRYSNKFFKNQLNLNISDNLDPDGTYITEKITTTYVGKIRYRERNFIIDYSQAADHIKNLGNPKSPKFSYDIADFTKSQSANTKAPQLDYRIKDN